MAKKETKMVKNGQNSQKITTTTKMQKCQKRQKWSNMVIKDTKIWQIKHHIEIFLFNLSVQNFTNSARNNFFLYKVYFWELIWIIFHITLISHWAGQTIENRNPGAGGRVYWKLIALICCQTTSQQNQETNTQTDRLINTIYQDSSAHRPTNPYLWNKLGPQGRKEQMVQMKKCKLKQETEHLYLAAESNL